jgi:Ser/Thr protein kinase RdoA (MazF antagonist)
MLGFYHLAVQGFDHEALHRPVERYGHSALSQIVQSRLESWQPPFSSELQALVDELKEHVSDLDSRQAELEQLPELVIHGDYHGANLIFQDHRVVGVVDYDLAHWCTRAMEVAEAMIYFCTDPEPNFKHIVYTGRLDLKLIQRFVSAYMEETILLEKEIVILPHMIRTIWLCASLDPPLEPPVRTEDAPQALSEMLCLVEWGRTQASAIIEVCLDARHGAVRSLRSRH